MKKRTLLLHWSVAVIMIAMITVGLYMSNTDAYALYPIHKSIGILALVLIALRVIWRIKDGWLPPVRALKKIEYGMARTVHWLLLIATLLMPLSGMLMSGAGGRGLAVFGFELMATNPDPANTGKVIALNPFLASTAHEVHELVGFALIGLIALHIFAALKHHFFDKDRTLLRMFGK